MDRHYEPYNASPQENRDKLFLWLAAEYSRYHQRKTLPPIEEFVLVPEQEPPPPPSKWCIII